MGIGNCCCLAKDFFLKSHCGISALSWSIFNETNNINDDLSNKYQNPINFDFSKASTTKFHSGAFRQGSIYNSIFSYDICSEEDGSYVYVAAGDLGVEVYRNNNGVLSFEKRISLGITSRNSDFYLKSGLNIGGPRGSLYGYETDNFHGAYSLCVSKNKNFIYVAVGKVGIYYVDIAKGLYHLVYQNKENSIFNKLLIFEDHLIVGSTGYQKPVDNLKFHRYDSSGDYTYPSDVSASGVLILRIEEFVDRSIQNPVEIDPTNPNSIIEITNYAHTLGVNDIFVHKNKFTKKDQNGQDVDVGDCGLYIALGKRSLVYNLAKTSTSFENRGGAHRIIFNVRTITDNTSSDYLKKDWRTQNISSEITKTGTSANFDQPIMTISANKEKIYMSTGVRYGKIFGSQQFSKGADNSKNSVESSTFTNSFEIENSSSEIGMSRMVDFCTDTGIPAYFKKNSWAVSPSTQRIEFSSKYPQFLNTDSATFVGESYVSNIKFFGNTRVVCYKGLGVTIGNNDYAAIQRFKGLTMKSYDSQNPDPECFGWQSGSGLFGYKDGWVNTFYSWSPIKSYKAGKYIFILNSMQSFGNESGPGYHYIYNEENEEKFVGSSWEDKMNTDPSLISGITVLESESK